MGRCYVTYLRQRYRTLCRPSAESHAGVGLYAGNQQSKCGVHEPTNRAAPTIVTKIMVDKEQMHEILTSWWTIIIAALAVYYLFQSIRLFFVKRHLGCVDAPYILDGLFGFSVMVTGLKHQLRGTFLDFRKDDFIKYKKHTFRLRAAGSMVITTKNPENIKALLATQFNDFALGDRHSKFKILLGDGIFTMDGDGWKHSRAMLRPQFSREQISHVHLLEPHIQIFAKHVRKAQGSPFDIQSLFYRLTVDCATEFLFGESVDSLRDSSIGMSSDSLDFDGKQGFAEAFNTSQRYLALRALAQKVYFLVDSPQFRRANRRVHKFADYYVQKALNLSPDEIEKKSNDGYIFLYELAKYTRDPTILRDQLLNILLAGRDTTAGLLSFTFFELSRNPQIWAKLKAEIYSKFGNDDALLSEITFHSLKRCDYLKAILSEVLRLYPSVPQNSRVATKNTTLPKGGGSNGNRPIFVPKGQVVGYSPYSLHRDEQFYGKDCELFRPERWLGDETRKLGWAYVPFNGGPRICLGQQFALTEASYIIVRLAQLFPNLHSHDKWYPPRKSFHLTLSHQKEVKISMT